MVDPTPHSNPGQATPEEMAAAITSSGYLIEARVARVLANQGFFVQRNIFCTNPNDATKPIEVDVVGRRGELVNHENMSMVTASVITECKNNDQPVAFFVQPQEITELNDNWIKYGGYPSFSLDHVTNIHVPLHKLLEMKDWHHYCQASEVATQFCTFTRTNGKKWKAEPNDRYSKSFSNLALMATLDCEGMGGLQLQNIQVQISYPVVVFQGPIYRVVEEQDKPKLEAVNHIQLHHSCTLNGQAVGAQIDLVTESELPVFLETVLAELRIFRDRINSHYDRLLNSALDQKRFASSNAFKKAVSEAVPSSCRRW